MAAISMMDTSDAIKRPAQTSLSNRFLFICTQRHFQWFAGAPSSLVFVTKQTAEKLTKKEKPNTQGGAPSIDVEELDLESAMAASQTSI